MANKVHPLLQHFFSQAVFFHCFKMSTPENKEANSFSALRRIHRLWGAFSPHISKGIDSTFMHAHLTAVLLEDPRLSFGPKKSMSVSSHNARFLQYPPEFDAMFLGYKFRLYDLNWSGHAEYDRFKILSDHMGQHFGRPWRRHREMGR